MTSPTVNQGAGDWRSYDEIADRYDRVWSIRFEAVARHIWAMMPPRTGANLLDIGTGTGIVSRILYEIGHKPGLAVGLDRSVGMLARARGRLPELAPIVADACTLPFAGETFDMATASFVLSHIPDYAAALSEVHRVLKPAGRFAVSNWAPSSDPYSSLWTACLTNLISKQEVDRALAEVAPWEAHFSRQERLESALSQAGFLVVASATPEFEFAFTVEQFIQDRELSSGGRLGFELVGAEAWAQFRAATSNLFCDRFGQSLSYARHAIIVVGRRP